MAKVRGYEYADVENTIILELNHLWVESPYEPGAYHTIYPYHVDDMPVSFDAWENVFRVEDPLEDPEVTWERGLVMAKGWASMPWMVLDACRSCHYTRYGPSMPRWNIMRGGHSLPYPPSMVPYPPRLLRCYVQRYDDPPPPGEG